VDEDAFDMRKALSRDVDKKSVVPLPHPVRPDELDWPYAGHVTFADLADPITVAGFILMASVFFLLLELYLQGSYRDMAVTGGTDSMLHGTGDLW